MTRMYRWSQYEQDEMRWERARKTILLILGGIAMFLGGWLYCWLLFAI